MYDLKWFTGFTMREIEKIHAAVSSTENFDFPDYGGLPTTISSKLTSEQVDYLQQYPGGDLEDVMRALARGNSS